MLHDTVIFYCICFYVIIFCRYSSDLKEKFQLEFASRFLEFIMNVPLGFNSFCESDWICRLIDRPELNNRIPVPFIICEDASSNGQNTSFTPHVVDKSDAVVALGTCWNYVQWNSVITNSSKSAIFLCYNRVSL